MTFVYHFMICLSIYCGLVNIQEGSYILAAMNVGWTAFWFHLLNKHDEQEAKK